MEIFEDFITIHTHTLTLMIYPSLVLRPRVTLGLELFYLFIYLFGCFGSQLRHTGSFVVARGLFQLQCAGFSLVVAHGLPSVRAQQLQCVGLVALWHVGSQLSSGMWGLSFPIWDQTCVPCIEGGFLTTGSPGKSQDWSYDQCYQHRLSLWVMVIGFWSKPSFLRFHIIEFYIMTLMGKILESRNVS